MKFFALCLAIFSATAFPLEILSQWVVPGKRVEPLEFSPVERTRPIVIGDIVYMARRSGEVMAVHRTLGYVFWKYKMPSAVEGALNYGRSLVVAGDVKGNLVALNARDGSEAWKFKAQAEWLSPPAITHGKILAVTSSDELYALGETDGQEKWHFSERGDEKMTVRGTGAPIVEEDDVYQGFSDGNLVALSASKGKEKWKRKLSTRVRFYDVDFTPVVNGGSLYVATYDGNFYSLDRKTGKDNWTFNSGSIGGALVEADRIYFSGLDRNFYALNREKGEVIWKSPFDTGVGSVPTRAGSHLVVTTSADPVYVLSPVDGKVLWKGKLGTGALAPAAGDAEGWFFCLSNYGNLFSYKMGEFISRLQDPRTHHAPSALREALGDARKDAPSPSAT